MNRMQLFTDTSNDLELLGIRTEVSFINGKGGPVQVKTVHVATGVTLGLVSGKDPLEALTTIITSTLHNLRNDVSIKELS